MPSNAEVTSETRQDNRWETESSPLHTNPVKIEEDSDGVSVDLKESRFSFFSDNRDPEDSSDYDSDDSRKYAFWFDRECKQPVGWESKVKPVDPRFDMIGCKDEFHVDDSYHIENHYGDMRFEDSYFLWRTLQLRFDMDYVCEKQETCALAMWLAFDTIVVMPKSDGANICYQLNATGLPGVTVVIAPFQQWIDEQKIKMDALGIPCATVSSDFAAQHQDVIYKDLDSENPSLKLLYMTPETIVASEKLISTFESLKRRELLTRIVFTEAHCFAQTSHDFRPISKKLAELHKRFAAPITALTTTATQKVVEEIKTLFPMDDEKCMYFLMSSFARKNLKYQVMKKSDKSFIDAVTQMKLLYPRKSGIVYCLSKEECYFLKTLLKTLGLSAAAYHAELSNAVRSDVHKKWFSNQINVICTTTAFGADFDKPDVRFVIHFSLPKSIEWYYQETEQAGRDGRCSHCLLMYSYNDAMLWRTKMGIQGKISKGSSMCLDNLLKVVAYCENVSACRRRLLVEHFDEVYDEQFCIHGTASCDACERKKTDREVVQLHDVTRHAKLILRSIPQMPKATLMNIVDLYRGRLTKKARREAMELGHLELPFFEKGRQMSKENAGRLMRKLITERLVYEELGSNPEMKLTEAGEAMISGELDCKVFLHVVKKQNRLPEMPPKLRVVTESRALQRKCLMKNSDLFVKCRRELNKLMYRLDNSAPRSRVCPAPIISPKGVSQIAAILPRTNSDLMRVDSMTPTKMGEYGEAIFGMLKPYWKLIDQRRAEEMNKSTVFSPSNFNNPIPFRYWDQLTPKTSPVKNKPGKSSKRDGRSSIKRRSDRIESSSSAKKLSRN